MDLSELIRFSSLDELMVLRDGARAASIEGLMLKRGDAAYVPGRVKGLWWKWKRDPLTVDAVLMYAQRGHGKRSSYYSDYTFGVWRDDELVPVGKAYFGFTDQELAFLDRWIRNHTVARFGPVREVEKSLVLEVAFDAAQLSNRHKSGVAMRFPRIARIRTDKPAAEADRLESLMALVENKPADDCRPIDRHSRRVLRCARHTNGRRSNDAAGAEQHQTQDAGRRGGAGLWRASPAQRRRTGACRGHRP